MRNKSERFGGLFLSLLLGFTNVFPGTQPGVHKDSPVEDHTVQRSHRGESSGGTAVGGARCEGTIVSVLVETTSAI